jgi:hypothetical protein
MRDLDFAELSYVSGAGSSPTPPSGCGCSPTPPTHEPKKRKGNNGFGNGGNDGSPNGFQDETR